MDRRLACLLTPELPLQLLLQQQPGWRGQPAAVVDEDHPQGRVLQASGEARSLGVLPGQRYATALSLCKERRPSGAPADAVRRATDRLVERLRRFTPNVEPSTEEPGVFWLDGSGLKGLFGSPAAWAEQIRNALQNGGFHSVLVVGFSRFLPYALARGLALAEGTPAVGGSRSSGGAGCGPPMRHPYLRILANPAQERREGGRIPLRLLGIDPLVRDRLLQLGVRTVADFVALPAAGLRERWGEGVFRLHRLAAGDGWDPLRPRKERPRALRRLVLEHPEPDSGRLLFSVKRLLDPLLGLLEGRGSSVAELRLDLQLQRHPRIGVALRPAAPTRDATLLLDLVRLRLDALDLPSPVVEMRLRAEEQQDSGPGQQLLFAVHPHKDRESAMAALARVRAELGDEAVGRFRLRDGHLPEARQAWEGLDRLPGPELPGAGAALSRVPASASPAPVTAPPAPTLVRRMLASPRPLPGRHPDFGRQEWHPRDLATGPVLRTWGPYVVSGGWWQGELQRDYAFAETEHGTILWVYYDRRRRRWFQQGTVE
jgi:protein ImuB